MDFDWSSDERWRDHDGRGAMVARILCVANGLVRMERWPRRGGRRTRFWLPLQYLLSPACGWRRAPLNFLVKRKGKRGN